MCVNYCLCFRQIWEWVLHDFSETPTALCVICHLKVNIRCPMMFLSLGLGILALGQIEMQICLFLLFLHLIESLRVDFKHRFIHEFSFINIFGYFDKVYQLKLFSQKLLSLLSVPMPLQSPMRLRINLLILRLPHYSHRSDPISKC